MPPDPAKQIVEVLETAGEPLDQRELVARTDLLEAACDEALDYLRGRQVVRYVPDQDVYRLTYWPDQQACLVCGEAITDTEYSELELRERATTTDSQITGPLHTACARELRDRLQLDEAK